MEPRTTLLFIPLCLVYVSAQFYQMPDPNFQARRGGGFRASLPDSCGVENFEFESYSNESGQDEWTGGNITQPQDGQWNYESSQSLNRGDRVKYRASVQHQGRMYRHPEAEWMVPDLVDEYETPEVDKRLQCNNKDRRPKEPKEEKPAYKSHCPWVDIPRPGDSREVVLEKQLVGLQCEMAAFMDRSARSQHQLTQELTELKKLNYAAVARMQRVESLVRNIPRNYPSYPFI